MNKLLSAVAALLLSCSVMAEGLLDANTASVEELAGLPHMDTVLAEMVIENRPYPSISVMHDLLLADLGEEELEELYAHVFIPINLNTAYEIDILLNRWQLAAPPSASGAHCAERRNGLRHGWAAALARRPGARGSP